MKAYCWPPFPAFCLLLALAGVPAASAVPKVEEQVVGPTLADAKYILSPQGLHLATVGRKGSRMMVTVDGVAGPKVDEVITPVVAFVDSHPYLDLNPGTVSPEQPRPQAVTFSQDGNHYAYLARVGQEWLLLEDNKEVLRLPAAGLVGGTVGIAGNAGNTDLRLQFGDPSGKHLYLAKSSYAGYELWVDGQKMPGWYGAGAEGAVDPVIYGAEGEHCAYIATLDTHRGVPSVLIVDGKQADYMVARLRATADGHLVGLAHTKDGDELLLDGKLLFKAKQIINFYLPPVGHRLFATLRHTKPDGTFGQFLLVDGKPAAATLSEQIKQVVFSPDGKRWAAVCGRPGAEFVVTDGKKGQEYQFIDPAMFNLTSGLSFSPDSSRVGYVANASGKKYIVLDEDESDDYDYNAGFRFLADGKGVLTYGRHGAATVVAINGKALPLPPNTAPDIDSFAWSPDQAHYAFIAPGNPNTGGPIYLDGKPTGLSGRFSFSPDSKHLAVVGSRAADGKSGLFVDGTLVYTVVQQIAYRAFTADSQHLYWLACEPVTTPNPTDAFEWVTYADGKAVAHHDRSPASQAILFPQGFTRYTTPPASWSVGADGALHVVTATPDGVKHLKITPGADTGLAQLLQGAGPQKH